MVAGPTLVHPELAEGQRLVVERSLPERAPITDADGEPLFTETEVVTYCREGLADYKRPRKVTFMKELPRNPTGKILKRELRELA